MHFYIKKSVYVQHLATIAFWGIVFFVAFCVDKAMPHSPPTLSEITSLPLAISSLHAHCQKSVVCYEKYLTYL